MKCGCKIYMVPDNNLKPKPTIGFCPLHAAAGEMLKMIKTVHREGAGMHYEAISELISRAEGKENL